MQRLQKEYGNVVRFYVGTKPQIFLFGAEGFENLCGVGLEMGCLQILDPVVRMLTSTTWWLTVLLISSMRLPWESSQMHRRTITLNMWELCMKLLSWSSKVWCHLGYSMTGFIAKLLLLLSGTKSLLLWKNSQKKLFN